MNKQLLAGDSEHKSSGAMPNLIYELAAGFMQAKQLFAASELGLFENLCDGAAPPPELARRMNLPLHTIQILLGAMCAAGLIERIGDTYQNSAAAAKYLGRQPSTDLRPFLRFWNELSYPRWTGFEDAVRRGRSDYDASEFNIEERKIFQNGVEAFHAGTATVLAAAYDFRPHASLLDLGGGPALFLKALLAEYPDLAYTLYDLGPAAEVARKRVAGTKFAEHSQIISGDFFRDEIPAGHDVFLLANVLDLFKPERNLALLRRIRERAAPGARLLIVDLLWADAAHTSPSYSTLMAGEFLTLSLESYVYSVEEVQSWLQMSGWRLRETTELVGPTSLIVAETEH